mgnify:FL=1
MSSDTMDRSDGEEWLAAILFVATVFAPAMELGGFGLDLGLKPAVAMFLAAIGGCVAGALAERRARLAGALGGLLAGLGILLALWLYVRDRDVVRRGEVIVVSLAGAAPGLLVHLAVRRLLEWRPWSAYDGPRLVR